MKKSPITLSAFKHIKALSEETICFTANVHYEGRILGQAHDRGYGGMVEIRADKKANPADMAAAESWASAQTIEYDGKPMLDPQGAVMTYGSLEDYLQGLAGEYAYWSDIKASLRRQIKNKTLFFENGVLKLIKTSFDPRVQAHIDSKHPGATILNAMPFDEAVKLFADWNEKQT